MTSRRERLHDEFGFLRGRLLNFRNITEVEKLWECALHGVGIVSTDDWKHLYEASDEQLANLRGNLQAQIIKSRPIVTVEGTIRLTGAMVWQAILQAHPRNPMVDAVAHKALTFARDGNLSKAIERLHDALILAESRGEARAFLEYTFGDKTVMRRIEAIWALPYGVARSRADETIEEETEPADNFDARSAR